MKEKESNTPDQQRADPKALFTRRWFLVNTLYAIGAGFGFSSINHSYETNQINGQLDDIYPLVRNLNKFAHEETRIIIKAKEYELERQRAISILTAFQRLGVSAASIILARKLGE